VRRDVRIEEDRAFRRSCELRKSHICRMIHHKGTQPQVSITSSSRVTGPPSTATGSQVSGTQPTSARASRSQTFMLRSMDETKGHEGTAPQEVTSGKRKPRWFQETLKEAKELIGEPQRLTRESRAPKRFGPYLAMVTSITDS
jgi:hypothetical protein